MRNEAVSGTKVSLFSSHRPTCPFPSSRILQFGDDRKGKVIDSEEMTHLFRSLTHPFVHSL